MPPLTHADLQAFVVKRYEIRPGSEPLLSGQVTSDEPVSYLTLGEDNSRLFALVGRDARGVAGKVSLVNFDSGIEAFIPPGETPPTLSPSPAAPAPVDGEEPASARRLVANWQLLDIPKYASSQYVDVTVDTGTVPAVSTGRKTVRMWYNAQVRGPLYRTFSSYA